MAPTRPYLAALAAAFCLGTTAGAEVITFEDYPIDNHVERALFHKGYWFDNHGDGGGILRDNYLHAPLVRNGTTRIFSGGDFQGSQAYLDVWRYDEGGTFSLRGFDAATMFQGFAGGIEVIGRRRGGGTVTASFDLTDHFASYELPDTFTLLESVRVRDLYSGPYAQEPGFALDNLDLEITSPEPSALALSGLGGAAVAAAGWRRRRAAPGP